VLAPVQYASQADIFLKRYGNDSLHLKGNTMRVDKEIRELGGAWNHKAKAWQFPSWQKNALETKLGIKLWEDSSQQMALRDAEEEFLQEWFEEEGVSLQENTLQELHENETNMLFLSTPQTIPASLRQGLKHAITRFNSRCTIPSSVANVVLVHDEDYFDTHWRLIGEYRLTDAAILLNTGREPEELLLAVFWHEYAHHVYYTLALENSTACTLLFEELRKTDGYNRAENYDREEGGTYWVLETELWARLVGQYFLLISEERTDYHRMVEMLEEAGMQQWSYSEIKKLTSLLTYILSDIGFSFTPAHDE